MEEVVEEVRSFPVADRLRLVERIIHEIAEGSTGGAQAPRPAKPSPVGWLAGEPETADQLEKLTAEVRAHGRARGFDEGSPH